MGKSLITVKTKGNFKHLESFLLKMRKHRYIDLLGDLAQQGVDALSAATPIDSGETAQSWSYEILVTRDGYTITWNNSNIENGLNVAVLIQYGHGTRGGGYVEGIDYINPALRPIFDNIAETAWKRVTEA